MPGFQFSALQVGSQPVPVKIRKSALGSESCVMDPDHSSSGGALVISG